jgi:RimJ/RimL family protein N-acetyltransferase
VELRDDGFVLRRWESEDAEDLAIIGADPLISRFLSLWPENFTLESAEGYIAFAASGRSSGTRDFWAVTDEETGAVLGSVELFLADAGITVGYWMREDFRGRGMTARAVRIALANAFRELRFTEARLVTHPENVASQRVAEKLGFEFVGLVPHKPPYKDGCAQSRAYRLSRQAFLLG